MRATFDLGLRLLLAPGREGGFSNDDQDPGGMTMMGVTKRQWEKFVGHEVSESDMRALTPSRISPFYRQEFWNRIRGDDLPAGVDYCVFDCAVNGGPGRAAKLLQGTLGLTEDGVIGPMTLSTAAVRQAWALIPAFSAARLTFMKGLEGWDRFGGGWETRVKDVEKEALTFAGQKEEPLIS